MKITSPINDSAKKVVRVQARQHAWESGSSWIGEGLIEWFCGDSKETMELRNSSVIYYVPIMDVDNVAKAT